MKLAVRVPSDVISELHALVPQMHPTRAEAVRAALKAYLYRLACERDSERYALVPLDETERRSPTIPTRGRPRRHGERRDLVGV